MKNKLALMAAGMIAAGTSFHAQAISYTLDFSGGGVTATGTIDVTGNHDTAGSITVSGAAKNGTFTFAPVSPVRALDGTDIIFDNVVNIGATHVLTGGGLGFGMNFSDQQHADYVLNIWGNGDGSFSLFEAGQGPDGSGHVYSMYNGSLRLTEASSLAAPDGGSSAAMLGCSLGAIGLIRNRLKKLRRDCA